MQLKGNSLQRLTGFVEGALALPTSDTFMPMLHHPRTAGTLIAGSVLACSHARLIYEAYAASVQLRVLYIPPGKLHACRSTGHSI